MKLPSLPSNAVANAAAAMVLSASLALSPLTASPALAAARTVGEVQTSGLIFKDTLRVEAFDDPKVDGVLLYLSDFQRPVTEKISKGDIFSDPSQGGLACSRKGDVVVKQDADKSLNGEEVFSESRSLVFKSLKGGSVVYAVYSQRLDKNEDSNNSRFKSNLCALPVTRNFQRSAVYEYFQRKALRKARVGAVRCAPMLIVNLALTRQPADLALTRQPADLALTRQPADLALTRRPAALQMMMDGLDADSDSVGPGIYGGRVARDTDGNIVIGQQYEQHNPLPGPVYAGGGYTKLNKVIRSGDHDALRELLASDPAAAGEISTGGATPLHVCGMSRVGQTSAGLLVAARAAYGYDIDTIDTWGYTALQRCATNDLAIGAQALLDGGASHMRPSGLEQAGESARMLARRLRSYAVLRVFQQYELAQGLALPDGEIEL